MTRHNFLDAAGGQYSANDFMLGINEPDLIYTSTDTARYVSYSTQLVRALWNPPAADTRYLWHGLALMFLIIALAVLRTPADAGRKGGN